MPRTSETGDWFEQLFGFVERGYDETRRQLVIEDDMLRSRANDRVFPIGRFGTPSLAELRERTAEAPRGELRVTHVAIGDVLELHAMPENRDALFQVASQFNCLEFASPHVTPEDGVTGYAYDPTQGPACSLAAAAATVYRNYFVPVGGKPGQTRDRQIDNLAGLDRRLGEPGAYWTVVNGYTNSEPHRLARLERALAERDRESLLGEIAIGLHEGVGVTFADRFTEPTQPTRVSQAFCSALSCGYSDLAHADWEPLATLVLDAAYEATLRAALVVPRDADATAKVWLTRLGGGAFGNRMEWITAAIGRALAVMDGARLDVRIAHYRRIDSSVQADIERARRRAADSLA